MALRPALALAWNVSPPAIDAGVPDAIAAVIAAALTAVARVTFVSSDPVPAAAGWVPIAGGAARRVDRGGSGLWPGLRGAAMTLISTTDPGVAAKLFDDAGFPWWLQGQVAFLSVPAAPLPDLDYAAVAELIDTATIPPALRAEGTICGTLHPGTDGDFALVAAYERGFDDALLVALAAAAGHAAVGWAILGEDDLLTRLAAP